MSGTYLRLGEILIEAGMLKPEQLETALALQKKRQLRLGTILLQERYVTEAQLVQALSRRLSIPWVSLWHIDIPDGILKLVPVSVAEEFFLIPIYIQATASGERVLFVAMNDPTDDAALRFVSAASNMQVKPMIAGPSDISAAIRLYYYGEEDDGPETQLPQHAAGMNAAANTTGPRSIPPPTPRASKPPTPSASLPPPPPAKAMTKDAPQKKAEKKSEEKAEAKPEARPEEAVGKPAAKGDSAPKQEAPQKQKAENLDESQKGTEQQQAQREIEKHMFGVGGKHQKAVTMTLLDGTTIDFGGATRKKKSGETFSRQDLVAGLRAAASGAPVEGFLPSEKWQEYMAALLEILMRKHLVLFDELMEEIKKKKS